MPAAAITAHESLQDRFAALAAGFQMHVPKPVEPAAWWRWWRPSPCPTGGPSYRTVAESCIMWP